jgi:hypothetical protein
MGLIIKGTQHINEMMLGFFLPIFGTCCTSLMNHLFFHHKFNKSFFGTTPLKLSNVDSNRTLGGAIDLSKQDTLLAG